MEKLLLALLPFTQKLDIIDNQHINRAKLALKANQITLFYCPDEPVDKIFAAEELYHGIIEPASGLEANRLQKMGFTQAGAAINKQWIISIARRLANGHTTGIGKPVAGPDDKIIKSIIRMKPQSGQRITRISFCFCTV